MSLKCEEEKTFDYVNNLKLLFIRKVQTKIKKKTSARILTVKYEVNHQNKAKNRKNKAEKFGLWQLDFLRERWLWAVWCWLF